MLKFPLLQDACSPRRQTLVSAASMACAAVWVTVSGGAWAQSAPPNHASIYSCVDAAGKRLTSDRLIADCLDREQRILNKDGSVRKVLPPRMNAEERAAAEARKRDLALAEAAQKDAARRDRNLLMRFPSEAVHTGARDAAMDDLHTGVALSERRLQELRAERKALDGEAEFYQGKRLPAKLRGQIEANDAQQQAQQDIIQQQRAEMVRLNAIYDAELARLRQLWAGATPGSVSAPAAPSAPLLINRPASSSAAR